MSIADEELQKAEILAKAKQILERSKDLSTDEFFAPLIKAGIIDEKGQVLLDMRYSITPKASEPNDE
jgi:hypothetical protein